MHILNLGFTGSQKGVTPNQLTVLRKFILELSQSFVIDGFHGDCIGADTIFHAVCRKEGAREVYKFPCTITNKCANTDAVPLADPRAPLDRNREIVHASDVMVACPGTSEEIIRSGTWATIRYARKQNKQLYVIYPDGSFVEDNPGVLEEVIDA